MRLCCILLLLAGAAAAQDHAEQAQFDFANGLFHRGFFEEAEEEYRAYLEHYPDGLNASAALFRLGESAFAQGRHEEALHAFERAAEQPGLPEEDTARARLRQGEALYQLGRAPEAAAILAPLARDGMPGEPRMRALYFLGKSQFDMRQFESALDSLHTLISTYSGDALVAYAQYLMAAVYIETGSLENAAVAFSEVAKRSAEPELRMESRFRAAEIYDQLGWFDAAVSAYQKLREEFPDSEYARRASYGHAWALYHAGHYAEAAAAADVIAGRLDSSYVAGALYLRASAMQQRKQYADALTAFDRLLADYTDSEFAVRAEYKRAYVAHLAGDHARARQLVVRFLERHKDGELAGDASFLLGVLLVGEGNYEAAHQEFRTIAERYPQAEFAPEALYKSAECLAQLGMAGQAADLYQDFATRYPDHPLAGDAALRAGDAEFFSDDFAAAVARYEEVLSGEVAPEIERDTLYRLAVAYHNMKDAEKSVAILRRLVNKYPTAPEAAEAYCRIGDHELRQRQDLAAALTAYQRALDAGADGALKGRVVRGMGVARYESGEHDVAAALFLRLIREHPDIALNETTYAWTGEHFFGQEEWDSAAAAYGALLGAFPDYPNPERVRFRMAQCLERAGKMAEALALYEQVVARAPASEAGMESRLLMARLHEAAGDREQAVRLYEEASAANSGDVAARASFRLAELLAEDGELERAARAYLRVAILFLHPELSPEALLRAGRVYVELDKPDRAREAFDQLLADFPDSEQAVAAREGQAKTAAE